MKKIHGNTKTVVFGASAVRFLRALGRGGFSSYHGAVIVEALGLDISLAHIFSGISQGRNQPKLPYTELSSAEWHFLGKVAYGQRVKVKDIPERLEDESREAFKRWSAKSSPAMEKLLQHEEDLKARPPAIPEGVEALRIARSETPGTKTKDSNSGGRNGKKDAKETVNA